MAHVMDPRDNERKKKGHQPWKYAEKSLVKDRNINIPGLVMTNSSPWYRCPIEIDGLPNLKMVIFHGYVTNNQMVIILYMVM
jgi:hypothetical protein